jgi:hypothetical protein
MTRVGKPVLQRVKSDTSHPNTTAQSSSKAENGNANITITNIVGPPTGGIEPLASSVRILAAEPQLDAIAPDILGDNVLDPNPKLHRFRAKRSDELEVVVDVEALTHIIHVLVDNHSIAVTPKDLEDILSYWGDPTVKTEQVVVKSRGVSTGHSCCSMTDDQREEVVETIKSVALNGLNLVKALPDLVTFLGKLGLAP